MIFSRTPSSVGSPACPFIAGPKIEDPALFVGRAEELHLLAARMSGKQPVSVNVAGGRLSGKSSLLWYFTKEWARYVPDPARFVVVYINLQQVKPATEAEFYQALAQALRKLPAIDQRMPLRTALAKFSGGSREFGEVLDALAGHGLLPVFCLDEFEKLFDHKDTLKKDFYDRLHSLTGSSRMMLIIATRRPVKVCGAEHQLLSAFFNFGQLCELKDFSNEEAEELLLLPSPLAPALDAEERRLLDPLAEDSEKCRKVLFNIVLPLAGLIVLACALLTGKVQPAAALDWLLKKTGLL